MHFFGCSLQECCPLSFLLRILSVQSVCNVFLRLFGFFGFTRATGFWGLALVPGVIDLDQRHSALSAKSCLIRISPATNSALLCHFHMHHHSTSEVVCAFSAPAALFDL